MCQSSDRLRPEFSALARAAGGLAGKLAAHFWYSLGSGERIEWQTLSSSCLCSVPGLALATAFASIFLIADVIAQSVLGRRNGRQIGLHPQG